jgi:hypothetical protein
MKVLDNIRLSVMCVIKHSFGRLSWRDTSLHIAESVLLLVMCVKKHSFRRLILRHTSLRTMASDLIPVMCLIKHSVGSLILSDTNNSTSVGYSCFHHETYLFLLLQGRCRDVQVCSEWCRGGGDELYVLLQCGLVWLTYRVRQCIGQFYKCHKQ